MLINYVQPTEEELFKKYNPELQKRSLEGRDQRLKEANEFIDRIKEYSKSDKPSKRALCHNCICQSACPSWSIADHGCS